MLGLLVGHLEAAACRKAVLGALHSWIKYGDAHTGIASPSLLQTAYTFVHLGLEQAEVLDDATDLVCEIFFKVHQLEQAEAPEWLEVLFAGLGSVWPKYEAALAAQAEDDDEARETVRLLCVLYAEAGQAFMLHFMGQPAGMQALLNALLRTAEAPSSPLETVQSTFAFWELLSTRVCDNTEGVQAAYSPVFARLFRSAVARHLPYPAGALSADDMDKFRDFRHVVGDTLKDCVRAMGSTEALLIVLELFEAQQAAAAWQPMEAVLFALRTIASVVDRRESEALPRLIPALLTVRAHPKLVYAVILNIGCYADWLRYHADLLEPILAYVAAGFAEAATCAAAAQALKYLCESCGRLLARFLPQLEALYADAAVGGRAAAKADRVELTEALAYILASLPLSQLPAPYSAAANPWLRAAAAGEPAAAAEALEHYGVLVQTLTDAEPVAAPDHPAATHFLQQAWPVLAAVDGSDARVSEALTEAIRSATMGFGAVLGADFDAALLQAVARLMQAHLPAVLALRTFVLHSTDARRDAAWPAVRALLASVVASVAGAGTMPDGVAELLSACTAAIDYCPLAADSELVPAVLGLANRVLASPTPAEVGAALMLLQHLLASTAPAAVLGGYLAGLSACLLTALSAALTLYPPDLLGDLPPILTRLDRLHPGLCASALQRILAGLPSDGFVERERGVWLRQFQDAMVSARANRELKDFLRQLAQACKRRLNP